jgi:hypothetical protein
MKDFSCKLEMTPPFTIQDVKTPNMNISLRWEDDRLIGFKLSGAPLPSKEDPYATPPNCIKGHLAVESDNAIDGLHELLIVIQQAYRRALAFKINSGDAE